MSLTACNVAQHSFNFFVTVGFYDRLLQYTVLFNLLNTLCKLKYTAYLFKLGGKVYFPCVSSLDECKQEFKLFVFKFKLYSFLLKNENLIRYLRRLQNKYCLKLKFGLEKMLPGKYNIWIFITITFVEKYLLYNCKISIISQWHECYCTKSIIQISK